jgi:hypothetical protein
VLLPRRWIEGMAVWVAEISRLPLRRRGKREVMVERRRSVGDLSFVRAGAVFWWLSAASAPSDWLRDDVGAASAACCDGRGCFFCVLLAALGVAGTRGLEGVWAGEDAVRGR